MSAYIMDTDRIEQIGRFVDLHKSDPRGIFVYREGRDYTENYMSGQRVAEVLMRENVRSVNYRYKERTKVPKIAVPADGDPPVELIAELLHTWDYQSCERKDFGRSEARAVYVRLLELTMDVAVGQLCREREAHLATSRRLGRVQAAAC